MSKGKSRIAISGCMLPPRTKERKFFPPRAPKSENLDGNAAIRDTDYSQLDNNAFVAGAAGYMFAIQILEQRNRIFT